MLPRMSLRHKHEPKEIRKITDLSWVEECENCGKRRLGRLGCGTESGTYYSRWFDSEEIHKLERCFPEVFKRIIENEFEHKRTKR